MNEGTAFKKLMECRNFFKAPDAWGSPILGSVVTIGNAHNLQPTGFFPLVGMELKLMILVISFCTNQSAALWLRS